MEWEQVSENLHIALTPHGHMTVEKRAGCWMGFDPWDDEPFLIGAPDAEFCKREADDWYKKHPATKDTTND